MKNIADRSIKFLLILCTIFGVRTVYSQTTTLTTPLQTQCSKELLANWDSVTNTMYGVAGTGFIGKEEWIGTGQAKRKLGGPWKPLDGYKHTMCGYMVIKKRGDNFHLISDLDGDLVFFVIPDPAFRWLQFTSLRPAGHQHNNFSLSCEIAIKEPGNTIASDAATYFKSIPGDSFQYKPVGVYGPWVTDMYHDQSPEIHPVQQIWRTEQRHDTLEYQLYSLFDNGSRFNNKNDFADSGFLKPWMQVPLRNVFYIPFSISINEPKQLIFDIGMPSFNNINEYASSENELSLVINGKKRLTANKPQNSFPKLSFTDVCQVDDNTIHGYLAIETSIGKADIKSGAHAVLKVMRSELKK